MVEKGGAMASGSGRGSGQILGEMRQEVNGRGSQVMGKGTAG